MTEHHGTGIFIVLFIIIGAVSPALAHSGSVSGGFVGGLSHPVFGPDHVAAMVAVGLWGAFLGAPAIYVLPVVFPLVIAVGGVLGIAGVPHGSQSHLVRHRGWSGACAPRFGAGYVTADQRMAAYRRAHSRLVDRRHRNSGAGAASGALV